ncbi:MAG TPA: hypothetical protein PKC91_15320 [Ignavibacteria bacterium]|nr:hypothetical protein [Ignavibacteria bacterium]
MNHKISTILSISILFIISAQISNAQWVLINNGIGNVGGKISLTYSGNYIFAGSHRLTEIAQNICFRYLN